MFELGRKPSQVILVVFLDQKSQKLQRISVPTDRQTLSMHQYLLIESHRRSVVQGPRGVLWSPAANTECYIFLKTTDSLPSDSGHTTCQSCAVFMIIIHQLSLIPYIWVTYLWNMRNIIIFSVQTYLFPIKVCTHDHRGFYAALITNLKFEGHSLFQG